MFTVLALAACFIQAISSGVALAKGYGGDTAEHLFVIQQHGLMGYMNRQGTMVIPPSFVDAWDFSEGLAAVQIDANTLAYIDERGQVLFKESPDSDLRYFPVSICGVAME